MSNPEVIVVIKGEELENTKDKNDEKLFKGGIDGKIYCFIVGCFIVGCFIVVLILIFISYIM